eukprot:scaffold18852_cov56-Skeletonema_dohrnii-CCMP3373.AAC.1
MDGVRSDTSQLLTPNFALALILTPVGRIRPFLLCLGIIGKELLPNVAAVLGQIFKDFFREIIDLLPTRADNLGHLEEAKAVLEVRLAV